MFSRPTVVFTSKEINLSRAQIGTLTNDKFRLKEGAFHLGFASPSGKVKYQAKDRPQGGLFQLEMEYTFNVTHTVTLGPGIFYFLNPNQDNVVQSGNGLVSFLRAHSLVVVISLLIPGDPVNTLTRRPGATSLPETGRRLPTGSTKTATLLSGTCGAVAASALSSEKIPSRMVLPLSTAPATARFRTVFSVPCLSLQCTISLFLSVKMSLTRITKWKGYQSFGTAWALGQWLGS